VLPLCDPHDLKDRDFKAVAEIIEIQQEVDFLAWIGMTQTVLQLKFLMQNMKSSNQRCCEPSRIFKYTAKG
jgi:hypothetical protein